MIFLHKSRGVLKDSLLQLLLLLDETTSKEVWKSSTKELEFGMLKVLQPSCNTGHSFLLYAFELGCLLLGDA